jgi:hypothetical protein
MAISRAQLAAELEPGLNALFGQNYDAYDREYEEIFAIEDSDRAFEEEVLITGFGSAPVKTEGQGVVFDTASEGYTSRYVHDTVSLAFALTEEAQEDNLYDSLGRRYVKALARSMMNTKEIKGADILNNDINAIKNTGVLPGGYSVNHYLSDPDAFFILTSITDAGEGLKMFQRTPLETTMEPDFTTGNLRYKSRERYSFGFSDFRGVFASQGA